MNEYAKLEAQAVTKLDEGRKAIPAFNYDEVTKKLRDNKISQKQKEEIMQAARASIVADSAYEALCNFCRQSKSFAKAVLEGGCLLECVTHVMGGTVYAISDLDIYKKCAAYYFPTAKIGMALTIDTAVSTCLNECETIVSAPTMSLKLDDFLS